MRDTARLKGRLDSVDVLRATAVLAVLAVHVHGFYLASAPISGHGPAFILDRAAAQGSAGVDLFVVLSGLCMTLPLVRGRASGVADIDPLKFYKRRAFRILPAYYAALAVVVGLELTPGVPPLVARAPSTGDIVAHLFLVQPLFGSTEGAINGPLWSISLEVSLYLFFPLLLAWRRRWGWTSLQVAATGLFLLWDVAGRVLAHVDPQRTFLSDPGHLLPGHLFQFTAGMWIADLVYRPKPGQRTRGVGLLLAGAPVGALGTVANVDLLRVGGWGAAAAGATLWVCSANAPRSGLARKTIARLGVVSYSFYLLHQPLLLLVRPLVYDAAADPLGRYALAALAVLPVIAAAAFGFFRVVERPFLLAGGMRDAIRADDPAAADQAA